MLKKAIIADIIPVVRMCKCGAAVSLNAMADNTICGKCGESVYENTKFPERGSAPASTDSE